MDSATGYMAKQKKVPKRRLILHFDINSTILMRDSAKNNNSVQYCVARALAKSAWGKVVQPEPVEGEEEPKAPEWKLTYDSPHWNSPAPNDADVMEYAEYLVQQYPKDGENGEENAAKRKEAVLKFTEEGQPGEKFQILHQKLYRLMELPENAKNELQLPEDLVQKVREGLPLWEVPVPGDDEDQSAEDEDEDYDDDDDDEGRKRKKNELSEDEKKTRICYGEGMFCIAPSFFRTLMYLKKQGRDFAVSFRSFGVDISDIIWEFNNFCEGKHPCFNGKNGMPLVKFNGENGTPDLRIRNPGQRAMIYRLSDELEDSKMIVGMTDRLTSDYKEAAKSINSDHQYQNCSLLMSVYDQWSHMFDTINKYGSMAIQEDYQSWKDNDFHREVSKLLLIDQGDQSTHHIFFDDNADEGEKCIVDTRDIVTKEILPYKKQIGRYVVQVDPLKVVLEPDYFIRLIEQCEESRDNEIANLEKGIMEDMDELKDQEKVVETEWQKLQKLPNDEYLMRTVLPVLYQGMQTLELQRPVAPIEYLAIYLLQNQHKIKMPPKDE